MALRDKIKLKQTLEELQNSGIIAPVLRPMPWMSSMQAIPRKNGKIRICLDPKDLSWALLRENYLVQTIEEIATSLHGAKVVSILHAIATNGYP